MEVVYDSGSLISIPQQYFGEKIKPGSFELIDTNNQNATKTLNAMAPK